MVDISDCVRPVIRLLKSSSKMPMLSLMYRHLVTHVVPGPQSFSYFIPLILLPIVLCIPRSVLTRWQSISIFLPVVLASSIHAWKAMGGVDVISVNAVLWFLTLNCLKDVHGSFKYVKRTEPCVNRVSEESKTNEGRLELTPYPQSLFERFFWVGSLLSSIRLNNWLIGEAGHDARQPPSAAYEQRGPFIRQSVISFIRGYLILDLTRAYIEYDPYFTDPMIAVSSPLPFETIAFVPPRLLRSTIIAAQAWAAISQMMYLPCILPVALNVLGCLPDEWSPHTWAPLFGSPKLVPLHGTRAFWSQYWHQSMRVSTTAPGYALADAMRMHAGGLPRYAVITVVAFSLSGLVHMGLVPPQPLYAYKGVWHTRLSVAGFFWLQPIAIILEVIVARLATQQSGTPERKIDWSRGHGLHCRMLINALFFLTCSVCCLPLLGDMGRQIGYWRVWPIPYCPWRATCGNGWSAWSIE